MPRPRAEKLLRLGDHTCRVLLLQLVSRRLCLCALRLRDTLFGLRFAAGLVEARVGLCRFFYGALGHVNRAEQVALVCPCVFVFGVGGRLTKDRSAWENNCLGLENSATLYRLFFLALRGMSVCTSMPLTTDSLIMDRQVDKTFNRLYLAEVILFRLQSRPYYTIPFKGSLHSQMAY